MKLNTQAWARRLRLYLRKSVTIRRPSSLARMDYFRPVMTCRFQGGVAEIHSLLSAF